MPVIPIASPILARGGAATPKVVCGHRLPPIFTKVGDVYARTAPAATAVCVLSGCSTATVLASGVGLIVGGLGLWAWQRRLTMFREEQYAAAAKAEKEMYERARQFAERPDALEHLMPLAERLLTIPTNAWWNSETYHTVANIVLRHDFITGPLAIPFFSRFIPSTSILLSFISYVRYDETRGKNGEYVLREEFTPADLPALEAIVRLDALWKREKLSIVLMSNIAEIAKLLSKQYPTETLPIRLLLLEQNARWGSYDYEGHEETRFHLARSFTTEEELAALRKMAEDPRLLELPGFITYNGNRLTARDLLHVAQVMNVNYPSAILQVFGQADGGQLLAAMEAHKILRGYYKGVAWAI